MLGPEGGRQSGFSRQRRLRASAQAAHSTIYSQNTSVYRPAMPEAEIYKVKQLSQRQQEYVADTRSRSSRDCTQADMVTRLGRKRLRRQPT